MKKFKGDKYDHYAINVYNYIPYNTWITQKEVYDLSKKDGKAIKQKHRRAGLWHLKTKGFIKSRIKKIKPLKGYSAKDVLQKSLKGTSRLNTGVVVNEYIRTDLDPTEHFEKLITARRKKELNKLKKSLPKPKRKTKITDEQAVYIKHNPDHLSLKAMARMFNVSDTYIWYIKRGDKRHVDMEYYIPIRDKIFKKVREESDFF